MKPDKIDLATGEFARELVVLIAIAIVVHISNRGEALLPASDARAGKGKHGTRTGTRLYA